MTKPHLGSLDALPVEVIIEIVSEDCLERQDLFCFLLTSKRYHRISEKWLYHTFDIILCKRRRKENPNPNSPIIKNFLRTLIERPECRPWIQRISTYLEHRFPPGVPADEDEWRLIWRMVQETPLFSTTMMGSQERWDDNERIVLVISLTPNLTRVRLSHLTGSNEPTGSHSNGRLVLESVPSCGFTTSGAEFGHRLSFVQVSLLRYVAATQNLQVGMDESRLEREHVKSLGGRFEGPNVQHLLLVGFRLSSERPREAIRYSAGVKALTVRWRRRPTRDGFLHVPLLRYALQAHRATLERLVLDMRIEQYDPERGPRLRTEQQDRVGSLRDFAKLKYLEITWLLVDESKILEWMPPSLETLVVLRAQAQKEIRVRVDSSTFVTRTERESITAVPLAGRRRQNIHVVD